MTAIVHDAREQWLIRRKELIGASDVAAILGEDPRRGALAVYAEKIGALEPQADNDWLAFGRDVEGAIAKGYARRTGRPVEDLGAFEIQTHPDIPWLGATLDRVTAGSEAFPAPAPGRGPLQLKAVGGRAVAEWKGREPVHYVIQVQIEIACTGAQWGALGALFHGIDIEPRDVPRSDRFIAAAIPRLEEFRWRVLNRMPPEEADGLESTGRALRALFAEGDGKTIALDHEALDLANRLATAKHRIAIEEDEAEDIANTLRLRIGAATFGALPDGSYLTLKESSRKGYEVKPKKFRALRRWTPRLQRR